VDGDLRAGLDVHGRECLAVKLVHPLGHFLHAAGEDPTHGLIAGNPHGSELAVVAGDDRDVAVVRLDERGSTGSGRSDQRLGA